MDDGAQWQAYNAQWAAYGWQAQAGMYGPPATPAPPTMVQALPPQLPGGQVPPFAPSTPQAQVKPLLHGFTYALLADLSSISRWRWTVKYNEKVDNVIEPLRVFQVAPNGWLQVVPYVIVNPYSPQYPQFYASAPVAYPWPAGYPPAPVIL